MSKIGRRIGIVAVHGIGNIEPHAHAIGVYDGLRAALEQATGEPSKIEGGWLHAVPEGTPVGAPPPRVFTARPNVADVEGIDVIEAPWMHLTKGFTSQRRLFGALRGALDTVQTAWRRSSRKSATEGIFIFGLVAVLAIVLAGGPTAAVLLAGQFHGAWFDTIVIAGAIAIAAHYLFRACIGMGNPKGYLLSVRAYIASRKDKPLLRRLYEAHAHARATSRPHQWVAMLQMCGRVVLASLPLSVVAMYLTFFRHMTFTLEYSGSLIFWMLVLVAVAPTAVRMVLQVSTKMLAPLEDIYTMCTFTTFGYAFNRNKGVVDSVAQRIQDVLATTDPNDPTKPLYDEVYVLGHSMGSYIAMRAILSLLDGVSYGALQAGAFKRIKGFVTYGAAIEKIYAHFGVIKLNERPNEAIALGEIPIAFGADGIPWTNVYYLWDLVADPITIASEHCRNVCQRAGSLAIWYHSRYVSDFGFWSRVFHDVMHLDVAAEPKQKPSFYERLMEFVRKHEKVQGDDKIVNPIGILRLAALFAIFVTCAWLMGHFHNLYGAFGALFTMLFSMAAIGMTEPEK